MKIATESSFKGSLQVKSGCAVVTVAPGRGVKGVATAIAAAAAIPAPTSEAMKIVRRFAPTNRSIGMRSRHGKATRAGSVWRAECLGRCNATRPHSNLRDAGVRRSTAPTTNPFWLQEAGREASSLSLTLGSGRRTDLL